MFDRFMSNPTAVLVVAVVALLAVGFSIYREWRLNRRDQPADFWEP
jgi:hypothetical protein